MGDFPMDIKGRSPAVSIFVVREGVKSLSVVEDHQIQMERAFWVPLWQENPPNPKVSWENYIESREFPRYLWKAEGEG